MKRKILFVGGLVQAVVRRQIESQERRAILKTECSGAATNSCFLCTLLTAHRALENPELFKSAYYSQALKAVAIGIFIRVIITAPVSPFTSS